MSTNNNQLLGVRPLARYLKNKIGAVDPRELRRLASAGEIPCLHLRGENGEDIFAFDGPSVEAALLRRARALPAAPTPEPTAEGPRHE